MCPWFLVAGPWSLAAARDQGPATNDQRPRTRDMPQLTDEDRANLVAYLDGELDAEAAQALEAKLSVDPTARAEADALKRTWELLDYLPRPEPSPSFTHRTLE